MEASWFLPTHAEEVRRRVAEAWFGVGSERAASDGERSQHDGLPAKLNKRQLKHQEKVMKVLHLCDMNVKPDAISKQVRLPVREVYQIKSKASRLLNGPMFQTPMAQGPRLDSD